MEIKDAVDEVLSGDLTKPLSRSALHTVARRCGAAPSELYNALLIEVSTRFLDGAISFEVADGVANDVWGSITSDMAELEDDFEMPQPAYSIYEAFDDGEYDHGDGDPVERHTRPQLLRILEGREER